MHIVQFDKTFLTGNLKDICVPGQCVTYPEYPEAVRHASLLEKVMRDGDFMRDTITGHKFNVSNVQLFETTPIL